MNESEWQKFEAWWSDHHNEFDNTPNKTDFMCGWLARAEQPSQTRAADRCPTCGSKEKRKIQSELHQTECHNNWHEAVPVEDRPACPTCRGKKERDTGINWCCNDAFHEDRPVPTPKFDKECLTCCAGEAHTKHYYGE